MKNKVLFIGFSVFQPQGLTKALSEMTEEAKLDSRVAFLGGHSIDSVSHLIDIILDYFDSDVVIFDPTSPAIRGIMGRERWDSHLDNIVQSCRSRGRDIGLVHFYRRDIDFNNDELVKWCDEYCESHGVKHYNLGRELHDAGQDLVDEYLWDEVHLKPEGDRYYAERLINFSQQLLAGDSPQPFAYQSRFLALSIPELIGEQPDSYISRQGPALGLTHIGPERPLNVTIPAGLSSRILLLVFGPRTGNLRVSDEKGHSFELTGYDAHSYFERLAPGWLPVPLSGNVAIEQLPQIPEVELLKGERDLAAREGKLAYFLATRD